MATYWSDMYRRRTCVYRLYDEAGTLLYVGLTMNTAGRFAKHARKPWWGDVAAQELEWFPDRPSAKFAEVHAIRDEAPLHNIVRPRLECC